ncbi:MAG TPA: hypothetical protein PLG73_10140 [Candidatus Sumerlaeota bacterium]|nr:hypothetical protein [Candidatus Sumerlaeota bacterium]
MQYTLTGPGGKFVCLLESDLDAAALRRALKHRIQVTAEGESTEAEASADDEGDELTDEA